VECGLNNVSGNGQHVCRLVISDGRAAKNIRIDANSSLVDLLPTFIDFGGQGYRRCFARR
jgi:hypothetical protein